MTRGDGEEASMNKLTQNLHSIGHAFWQQLHGAAHEFAHHGWSVVPGALESNLGSSPDQFVGHSTPGTSSIGPTTDAELIEHWWSQAPYPILLAIGATVSAIEVSADIGRIALTILEKIESAGPIVVSQSADWQFLVALSDEQDSSKDFTNSRLLLLPPWVSARGLTCWRVAPHDVNWQLADAHLTRLAIDLAHQARLGSND